MPRWNRRTSAATTCRRRAPRRCRRSAFALCTAIAVLDAVRDSGQVPQEKFGDVVQRISFFVNAGVRFVEEMCKLRAFVELWDEITRDRYGVQDPKQRACGTASR
jgi:(2R)-ethylmalonyl-CoA mutase